MIAFEHVCKRYGDALAVADLSLEIGDGEVVVLAGPSGCGKTTMLKMINRLIEPTSGSICINGQDTHGQNADRLRRSIGYVIQQVGLFPHHTVAQNVATVPRLLGWDRARVRRRVEELLELVGLPAAQFGKRLPGELSGGQRQRVGVARALGGDPPILLMDEPFGAIDPVTRTRLQEELLRLQAVLHKTIVFVTHDIDEAIRLGDRIVLLSEGGRLEQYSTPVDLLAQPATPFVEQFLGAGRFIRRLGFIRLQEIVLPPNGGRPPAACIDVSATLREALDAVLASPEGRVAVVNDGQVAGILDAESIRAAAQ